MPLGLWVWFGFGGFDEETLEQTSRKAAVCIFVASLFIVPWVLTVLVRANLGFVVLCLLSTKVPTLGLAYFNYEFPSLVQGIVGCVSTSILTTFRVLLSENEDGEDADPKLGALSEHSMVNQ